MEKESLYNARPNVPKFGNWENEDNTPYTVYFEKARQTRGTGKIINPNDPEENPDMFPNLAPPRAAAPQISKPKTLTEEPPIGRGGAARQTWERRLSKDDGEFRQYANSPARNQNMGRRGSNEPYHQHWCGSSSGRTGRPSAGSEHSFDKSPLHPHYQAKVNNAGRGAASPAWEEKNNFYDSSHGTPGRSFESSHAAPGRSKVKQESSDRGAAVPRFGEWDENDPQSADNYTHIFNKMREEKQRNPTGTPTRASYNTRRDNSEEKSMVQSAVFSDNAREDLDLNLQRPMDL
ncbi:putative cell division control protein 45 -like protein [Capsicum annuum]|nr:putative cell division control protein 45 -like protein [Capsicum annuum]